ncbi:MAG: MgtC/SapB family protein [Gemmatimonadales bacterium]
MPTEYELAARLAVAALAGIGVGMEREWSGHAEGPAGRFAGIRTFFLLGLLAGIAGWLAWSGAVAVAAVLLGTAGLFVVAAWVAAARRHPEDLDATTEVAALAVLALGALAGYGEVRLAAAGVAIAVLALSEKGRIHGFVRRIGEAELRAGLQFAVLALVVLPLLPEGPYGPGGSIQPRRLWAVVLIFSGLNFAGYLARRAIGESRGYAATGALGGLVSSTGVTLVFSRRSQEEPESGPALAVGVLAASTVVLLRLLVLAAVIDGRVALRLAPYLAAPVVIGLALVLQGLRRDPGNRRKDGDEGLAGSPLGLGSAIKMAVIFQAALLAVELVREQLGGSGIVGFSALLGLTDTDALTYSLSERADAIGGPGLAAHAIAVGLLSNTVVRGALALGLGRGKYRAVAVAGLGLLAAATGAGLALLPR